MKNLRPWLLGAVFGAAALSVLPLTGLLPQGVGAGGALVEGYRWLALRQSVTLRSLALVPPAGLDAPERAARAAGHYELVCRSCHAAPGRRAEAFAADLSPPPPDLAGAEHWRPPARVFLTLRDGLAHSAMPAWPSRIREDEIWDMVGFLRQLPELPPERYAALAGTAGCSGCHDDARPGIPRLGLQTPAYLAAQLRAYRAGQRASGPMQAAAHPLDEDQVETLARRFGKAEVQPAPTADLAPPKAEAAPVAMLSPQPAPSASSAPAPAAAPVPAAAPGIAALVRRGDPARDIPACLSCHGAAARADYPRLAGQDAAYLLHQLDLFARHGAARGGPHAAVMAPIAESLSSAERRALADYLATLPAAPAPHHPPQETPPRP